MPSALLLALTLTASAAEFPDPPPIRHPNSGWTAFGLQTGFLGTMSVGTAGLVAAFAGGRGGEWGNLLVVPVFVGSIVATGVLGASLPRTAQRQGWDRTNGWAAAFVWPGAVGGALAVGGQLAGASTMAIGTGSLLGAVAGGGLGYWAGKRLSVDRNPGTEFGFVWLGMYLAYVGTALNNEDAGDIANTVRTTAVAVPITGALFGAAAHFSRNKRRARLGY